MPGVVKDRVPVMTVLLETCTVWPGQGATTTSPPLVVVEMLALEQDGGTVKYELHEPVQKTGSRR